jgi:hypothetical protein
MTETVWLDGKKESFNVSHAEINLPDAKIEVIDPAVDIHVEVTEKRRGDLHFRFATRDGSPFVANLISLAHNP